MAYELIGEGASAQLYGALYHTGDESLNLAIASTYYTAVNYDASKTHGGVTVNTTNGTITIPTAGDYLVTATISFAGSGGVGDVFEGALFLSGVEQSQAEWVRKTSSNDTGSASFVVIITIAANDVLTHRIQNTVNTGSITIKKSAFTVHPL